MKYNATFDGAWARGCYHGRGRLYRPGMPTEELEYENGVLVSRKTVVLAGTKTTLYSGSPALIQFIAEEQKQRKKR